jgi:hypothetical protein
LGVGTFDYNCFNPSDAACAESEVIDVFRASNDLGNQKQLPQAVAVGSKFGLSYAGSLADIDGETLVTTEAAAEVDEIGVENFQINEPVTTAFFAASSQGQVADLLYVDAATPSELLVWSAQETIEKIKISEGDSVDLAFTLVDKKARLLAGAVESAWTLPDDSTAALAEYQATGLPDRESIKNRVEVTLTGLAAGETELTVTALDLVRTLTIEVSP